MNEFERYNPVVNFCYFVAVIVFAMIFMHPIGLAISLTCSFTYSIILSGRRAAKFNFGFLIPLLIIAALINTLFNHAGATIIMYFPNGNPLTLESVMYGVAAASMLCSVLCYFSCYNKVMTSDKFIYLFGRIIPSLSLIISMALRMVPRFKAQIREISRAQQCIGRGGGNILRRVRHGITVLSVMITWTMENSIETARSMKSRGYGLKGRSAFLIFSFDKRDRAALMCICILCAYIIFGAVRGGMYFRYFPSMKSAELSWYGVSVFAAYFMLSIMPVIIEIAEVKKWNAIKSKN
jgi:energy-coupling factor transport system permease protein